MIRTLTFVALIGLSLYGRAQSCSQKLKQAEDDYDQGKLLDIPARIESCLNDFSDDERIRAYKLLTKVYIFTDNEPKADEAMINLLKADKEHPLQPEDPNELRVLMGKFRTWPIYRLEVRAGGNMLLPSVQEEYSNLNEYGKTYQRKLSYQVEVDVTKHIRSMGGLELGAGVQFRNTKYGIDSGDPNQDTKTVLVNSQTNLRFPAFVRYNLGIDNNLIPYVFAGASFDLLMGAKYVTAARTGGTAVSANGTDLKGNGQVFTTNNSMFFGGGVKIRYKRVNFFFVEARFDKANSLYIIPEERYADQRMVNDLQFVEDDLILNAVSINFGYILSMYNPIKLTSKK
jgi:hypothetical protein